jgi:NADH-quinone oxidoreductase subunit I
MDQEYELSATNRFGGLLLKKGHLAKPNEYFHQIHPTEAAEVDGRLAAEKAKAEAAKAKPAATSVAATPAGTTPAAAAQVAPASPKNA